MTGYMIPMTIQAGCADREDERALEDRARCRGAFACGGSFRWWREIVGGGRRRSRSCRLLAQRAPGLAEEDVVEARLGERDRCRGSKPAASRRGAAAARRSRRRRRRAGRRRPRRRDASRTNGIASTSVRTARRVAVDADRDDVAGDLLLELVGRALGDDPAVVDDREAVAERVGLLEVVGREEDRRAAARAAAGSRPTCRARACGSRPVVGSSRKSTCGRWTMPSADVEPAAHAAGVRAGRAGRRRARGRARRGPRSRAPSRRGVLMP